MLQKRLHGLHSTHDSRSLAVSTVVCMYIVLHTTTYQSPVYHTSHMLSRLAIYIPISYRGFGV
jgi:hypothetical protein